jgi:hypothetical protein
MKIFHLNKLFTWINFSFTTGVHSWFPPRASLRIILRSIHVLRLISNRLIPLWTSPLFVIGPAKGSACSRTSLSKCYRSIRDEWVLNEIGIRLFFFHRLTTKWKELANLLLGIIALFVAIISLISISCILLLRKPLDWFPVVNFNVFILYLRIHSVNCLSI